MKSVFFRTDESVDYIMERLSGLNIDELTVMPDKIEISQVDPNVS
jgi:hypothetical protein